jgi:hypothetical protein
MSGSGQYVSGNATFRVGVNYRPRRTARDLWGHFDVDEVQEDFCLMSELGINLARVALLWDDFLSDPDCARCSALAHLLELCDAAASEGVQLELLLLDGSERVPSRLPDWLRHSDHSSSEAGEPNGTPQTDIVSDPVARRAATTLVKSVSRCVGGHPAVWAYNLGVPLDRATSHFRRAAAKGWLEALQRVIRAASDRPFVTCSIGEASLSSNDALRVDQVFSALDHCTVEPAGLGGAATPADAEAQAVFSCTLARALSGKPCMLAESWGSAGIADAELSSLARGLLASLHRAGALGMIVGTFADLFAHDDGAPESEGTNHSDFCPELHPLGEAIRAFAHERPLVRETPRDLLTLGVTVDDYYERPASEANRLYRQFLERWNRVGPR